MSGAASSALPLPHRRCTRRLRQDEMHSSDGGGSSSTARTKRATIASSSQAASDDPMGSTTGISSLPRPRASVSEDTLTPLCSLPSTSSGGYVSRPVWPRVRSFRPRLANGQDDHIGSVHENGKQSADSHLHFTAITPSQHEACWNPGASQMASASRHIPRTASSSSQLGSHTPLRMWPLQTDPISRRSRRRRWSTGYPLGQMWPMLIAFALLVALIARPAAASQGDRSPEYRLCVDSCDRDSCLVDPLWDDGTAHATRLPWILRVTRWTCIDDCRYHCTHRVTNEAHDRVLHIREEMKAEVEAQAAANEWTRAQQRRLTDAKVQARLAQLRPVQKEMVQYHGKWVFIRLLGAQEPLSVLFSLMNLYVHVRAFSQIRRLVPDYFPLKLIFMLHALLSCLAWSASAIFHARDKPLTERLDYFSAGGVILGGLFFTICRLFRLPPASRPFKRLAKGMGVAYALHVLYLSFGRFDYSYNMQANIIVALTHSLLWLVYSLHPQVFLHSGPEGGSAARMRSTTVAGHHTHSNGGSPPVPVSTPVAIPPSSSRKSRRQLQRILLSLWLASALEVFDFAPLFRALDAHALWHLATVPIARMWYAWLIEDARECVASGFWAGDMDGTTAKYLELPHKTEEAVGNMKSVVGPPVMRVMERAREWVETAAGKGSDAMAATGTSSGIEFKALTTKLNDFARSTLGNASHSHDQLLQHSHYRPGATVAGTGQSDDDSSMSTTSPVAARSTGGFINGVVPDGAARSAAPAPTVALGPGSVSGGSASSGGAGSSGSGCERKDRDREKFDK